DLTIVPLAAIRIEIGILMKPTQTGGLALPQTALMTTLHEGEIMALETSIVIVMIQTGTVMVHDGTWTDMEAGIDMMTGAAETMIEAMILG
uniref:Uncharacterized protein n=1 Tax=Vombatus ursinus TaxID=29139 RepID=A0A4X2KBJ0_VOMUR